MSKRAMPSKELYIGIGTEPEGLDPHIVTGVTEHYVLLSLFEGLTTVHPETLAIEPGVALELGCLQRRPSLHLLPRP
jgi:ABC-type oligopeptide transport system substrate-binding subunit